MAEEARFIVVGGGLAGLMTTIKLAEAGQKVDVFSIVPVKRSHSVCAQGGINGAVNTKGEGDHPDIHVKDTLKGGDFLAEQPPVKGMCYAAPGIIYLLDRMGVPFSRTPEGLIDFRRFGGTLHHRTAFAGATTGQQLLYALDEQVRRYEADGKVRKFEYWEFLGVAKDQDGRCRGISAMDLRTMEIKAFPASAVCLATGGPGIIFGRSTNSVINTGSAMGSAYQDGAFYGNPEMIQVHPTSIPGEDKLRLMSESIRGEGGRIWVPRDGKPWYFLEEKYPHYKNLVPRDVATREIFKVCRELKLGVDGKDQVYLDVTHIPADVLWRKIGGVIEIYEKFVGEDPTKVPMRIFPGMHYSMGGLWVDYEANAQGDIVPSPRNQSTNLPGLYAAGEVDYQYHGANRLGANSLLSCIYAGQICGPAMIQYAQNAAKGTAAPADGALEDSRKRWSERIQSIYRMKGPENPYRIHQELGDLMTEVATVVRYNDKLRPAEEKIRSMKARWGQVGNVDDSPKANQAVSFTNQLWNMLEMAHAMVKGALLRDECRGSHYKPDFETKPAEGKKPTDDPVFMEKWRANLERWNRTTIATHKADGPEISYRPISFPILKPEPRHYD
ncbi:MAG: succinate dehydrogenase flavoprotein subunit [Deltaproteobacteria bacterium]